MFGVSASGVAEQIEATGVIGGLRVGEVKVTGINRRFSRAAKRSPLVHRQDNICRGEHGESRAGDVVEGKLEIAVHEARNLAESGWREPMDCAWQRD